MKRRKAGWNKARSAKCWRRWRGGCEVEGRGGEEGGAEEEARKF